MLLYEINVKMIRFKLKLNWLHITSRNPPISRLIKIRVSVLEMLKAYGQTDRQTEQFDKHLWDSECS